MEGRDLKAHSGLRADFCWGFCFCEFIPAGSLTLRGCPKDLDMRRDFCPSVLCPHDTLRQPLTSFFRTGHLL